ncbi:hypothetical protein, partial [Nostoc sp. UHCC 0251]|uniref:hypothetical protein n=1 Tax=Nostoc sp. UHCC 0251 TaxID=3110240 RepID=UPI002B2028AF
IYWFLSSIADIASSVNRFCHFPGARSLFIGHWAMVIGHSSSLGLVSQSQMVIYHPRSRMVTTFKFRLFLSTYSNLLGSLRSRLSSHRAAGSSWAILHLPNKLLILPLQWL